MERDRIIEWFLRQLSFTIFTDSIEYSVNCPIILLMRTFGSVAKLWTCRFHWRQNCQDCNDDKYWSVLENVRVSRIEITCCPCVKLKAIKLQLASYMHALAISITNTLKLKTKCVTLIVIAFSLLVWQWANKIKILNW